MIDKYMTIKHTQSELANNRMHDKDSRLQASVKFIESIMIQNDNDMHAVLISIPYAKLLINEEGERDNTI